MGVMLEDRCVDLNAKVGRLPQRYGRLVAEVLGRLPDDWLGVEWTNANVDIRWTVVVSDDIQITHRGCVVLASVTCDRIETLQYWTITLFPRVLDELSDGSVLWVIAHEFGHIAARGTPGEYRKVAPAPVFDLDGDEGGDVASVEQTERCADTCAVSWGFSEERAVYARELPIF